MNATKSRLQAHMKKRHQNRSGGSSREFEAVHRRLTHRSPCTALQTTFARPLRHTRPPSSPQPASAAFLRSSAPIVSGSKSSTQSPLQPGFTHLLDECLEHSPAIAYVATEARTARIRLARKLLRTRKVDAVVADGQPCAIEAGAARAADIHHHAVRLSIRTMRDLVFVEKAQTLVLFIYLFYSHWGGGEWRVWWDVPRAPGGCSRPRSRRSAVAGGRSRIAARCKGRRRSRAPPCRAGAARGSTGRRGSRRRSAPGGARARCSAVSRAAGSETCDWTVTSPSARLRLLRRRPTHLSYR